MKINFKENYIRNIFVEIIIKLLIRIVNCPEKTNKHRFITDLLFFLLLI